MIYTVEYYNVLGKEEQQKFLSKESVEHFASSLEPDDIISIWKQEKMKYTTYRTVKYDVKLED